jgi:DNA-binding HxlR family transcriptional regulator
MIRYGPYCPIAKALETARRTWTLLIVRELLREVGASTTFGRGVPLMSPS